MGSNAKNFLITNALNHLNAGREFCSPKMGAEEPVISHVSRAKQLCIDLKAIGAVVSDQELVMTVL